VGWLELGCVGGEGGGGKKEEGGGKTKKQKQGVSRGLGAPVGNDGIA